jgi:hypothetical protein
MLDPEGAKLATKKKCEICGGMFTDLLYHKYTHLDVFKCEICNVTFETKLELKDHDTTQHNVKSLVRFRCRVCDKPFRSKPSFNRHLVKAHSEKHLAYNLLPDNFRILTSTPALDDGVLNNRQASACGQERCSIWCTPCP